MRTLRDVLPVVDAAVNDDADVDALLAPLLEAIDDAADTVTGTVAVHALARIPGPHSESLLARLIDEGVPGYEQHALWALTGRRCSHVLTLPLARAVARGGTSGMHAQRALARWAVEAPGAVLDTLGAVLDETTAERARRYLVETVGLVPGRAADAMLTRVALDDAEAAATRRAAVDAYAERLAESLPAVFEAIGTRHDEVAASVRATRALRRLAQRGPRRDALRADGIRIAQIHFGEAGGLATLLPHLGDALAGQQRVAETITIAREGAVPANFTGAPGHRLETIELEDGEGAAFGGSWPGVVSLERGIRASLLASSLPDVLHLRMADPGSLAGAVVARSFGIPLVFTLAPDPHGPIASAEAAGTLDRRTFASKDAPSALWLRAYLVERLAREAREVVLFPRAGLPEIIERLTGIDLRTGPPRHTVVAEGIDTARTDEAAATITGAQTTPPVLADLLRAIDRMPPARRGLPLVVSAGRMVSLKGMARLVEAFGRDQGLAARANLVIVGGDLEHPSAAEAAEMARIHGSMERHPGLADRVVLLGRRDHHEVALLLAAARAGIEPLVGSGGSYVCASDKEEFGLAIVEAMAAGLPVTVPAEGGPATYVEAGMSGAVVDTTDPVRLASGIVDALELSRDPATAARTRATVDAHYTLERMARTLSAVYRVSAGAVSLGMPVAGGRDAA